MSKKKRARRERQQEIGFVKENLEQMKQEALRFIDTASTFELSYEMSRRGITTTHRDGIFALLDADFMQLEPKQLKCMPENRSERILATLWRREMESKGRQPTADDLIFLLVVSLHFAMKWAESRLEISNAQLAALKTELSAKDAVEKKDDT